MRKSRVLLAGVAVAAAAAATSAFTASNTSTIAAGDLKAGYGEVVVSGVTVSNTTYTPLAADASKLSTAVFTVTGDVSTQHAVLTLKKASPAGVVGSYPCTLAVAGSDTAITCSVDTATAPSVANPDFESFDTVGLTVTH
jgi:hypothetical protein